jgi:hypothetical protein
MGGKGGVGKTGAMTALADWYEAEGIPTTMLDLDTENKARGSFQHYFPHALKRNIHTPAGLDDFLDCIDRAPQIILADMGAGAGQVTHEWFDSMYENVAALGVRFTAIGVITSDPASVASVLGWVSRLQDRVDYLIMENCTTPDADFRYWRDSEPAIRFRDQFCPVVVGMGYRLPEFENTVRHHGVRLSHVADGTTDVEALQMTRMTIRAQSYRRQLFTAFETAKEVLLP